VSFYLAVRPRVAAREQFAMCPGMLLFFWLFLLILIKIIQFNRHFARRHKMNICLFVCLFVVGANGDMSVGTNNLSNKF
jgi:hypothetical protein